MGVIRAKDYSCNGTCCNENPEKEVYKIQVLFEGDWLKFNYCMEAIKEDRKRKFQVEFIREEYSNENQ